MRRRWSARKTVRQDVAACSCVVVVAVLLSPALAYAASANPQTRLAISVYPKGRTSSLVRHYRLRCNPASGTVPRSVRACRVLARLKQPFAPVPPDTICADVTLGPQEAVVKGLLRGQAIDAHLDLRGSCEIQRWRRVAAVVPDFPNSG